MEAEHSKQKMGGTTARGIFIAGAGFMADAYGMWCI